MTILLSHWLMIMNTTDEIKKQLQDKGWQNDLFSSDNMHTLLMTKILLFLDDEEALDIVFGVAHAIHNQKHVQIEKNLMFATEKILNLEEKIDKGEIARNDTDSINSTFNNVLEELIK